MFIVYIYIYIYIYIYPRHFGPGKGSKGELTTPFELTVSESPSSRANTCKSTSSSSGRNMNLGSKEHSPPGGLTTSFELTLSDTKSDSFTRYYILYYIM